MPWPASPPRGSAPGSLASPPGLEHQATHIPPGTVKQVDLPLPQRVPTHPVTVSASHVLERPYTVGGGGVAPPGTPPPPGPPPPLLMFEASSQIFASAPLVPRGFRLQNFRPAFGRDHRGPWEEGGPSQPPPPPPSLSNTSLVSAARQCPSAVWPLFAVRSALWLGREGCPDPRDC